MNLKRKSLNKNQTTMSYKITKADLIGEIADFPIEVVEKMIERQVEQGNVADVSVFQRCIAAGVSQNGFSWCNSREGTEFWCKIVHSNDFDIFFNKYPKYSGPYVYIVQDGTKCGSDVIETLVRRGGINELNHRGMSHEVHYRSHNEYYYLHPTTKAIRCAESDSCIAPWLKTFYTEIDVEPSIKEYTMQEIADKLGIDVANLRIKK